MALININYESKTLGMPVMINAIIPQGRGSYKTLYPVSYTHLTLPTT